MAGAGYCVRADDPGPGQNSGAARPAGTGKPHPLRAGACVAGAVGNDRAAATHRGSAPRHPAAAHRRASADQSGGLAEVPHPPGGNGAVQRVPELEAERRRTTTPWLRRPTGPGHSGATVRQTIIGLEFGGPRTIWGGKVNGSVYMDFFAGATNSAMRIRTASIEIDWKNRSVMAGLEKPIFNPREPSSLAQVGISPLTGAGNLWLWLPQVRFEQDLHFNATTGMRAQIGAVQTREIGPYVGHRRAGSGAPRGGRARSTSITSSTKTGAWRSPPGSTPARPMRAANRSPPASSRWTGSSIRGSALEFYRRVLFRARMWPTWAAARARASPCIRLTEGRTGPHWAAGRVGTS